MDAVNDKGYHQPSFEKWQAEVRQIEEQIAKLQTDLDSIRTFPSYCRREEIFAKTGEPYF